MECALLWAGVCFSAQNGDPEGLLTAAAAEGLHLSQVLPCPGGFSAQCAAWRYRRLAGLASKHRVRLRTERRRGAFFVLRPFFRRRGLWAGLLLFLPLLFWLQGAVWAVDGSGPDCRAAGSGRGGALGERLVPRQLCYRGKTPCRRICSSPKRRVFLGQPQF